MEGKTSANIEHTTSRNNYSHFFFHLLYRLFFSPAIILHYIYVTTTKSIHLQGTTTTMFVLNSGRETQTPFLFIWSVSPNTHFLYIHRASLYTTMEKKTFWVFWGYFVLLLRLITVLGGIKAPLISVRYPWEILHWRFLWKWHFIKILQATETQVTDLGDACLLNIYSVRPFNRLHLAPTLLDPGSCGAPQCRRPSKHPRHLLRPHPRTQGHFKERARGARAHGAGVGGWRTVKCSFPIYFLKVPHAYIIYGEPPTQADGKISCNLSSLSSQARLRVHELGV